MGSWILPHSTPGSNNSQCRLPSIHSLSLDLPALGMPPPAVSAGGSGGQLGLGLAPGLAVVSAPPPYQQPQRPLVGHQPVQAQQKEYSQSYLSPPGMVYHPHTPKSYGGARQSGFGSEISRTPQLISPISSPPVGTAQSGLNSLCTAADMEENFTARKKRALSESPVDKSSEASAASDDMTGEPERSPSADESANLNEAVKSEAKASNWKPRKKRQCPECKLYFSNLATHKSTHLKPASRPHICEYCSRGFARPNDLFRHVKCHWKELGSDKGQFRCPYKMSAENGSCFHTSGIFSRCDTFKNHLKAIHFQYPLGTRRDQRNKVNGHCKQCHKGFKNVDDWMVNHIEKNLCPYASPMKKN